MALKTLRRQIIEETDEGLYAWKMPDGSIVMDEDRNWLNIRSKKGDLRKIKVLQEAVKHHTGTDEGTPIFLAGHRQIDDEEFEYQKQRLAFGLIPDPQDMPAIIEEAKDRLERNKGR